MKNKLFSEFEKKSQKNVLICGGGYVGLGIAEYLVQFDHKVTVIDSSSSVVKLLNQYEGIKAIKGNALSLELLNSIQASTFDAVIALTALDEINILICQVANRIYKIPLKICRIKNPEYLHNSFINNIAKYDNSISFVISPETEITNYIYDLFEAPGICKIDNFFGDKLKVIEIRINENSKILKADFAALVNRDNLRYKVLGVIRSGQFIYSCDIDKLYNDDHLLIAVLDEYLGIIEEITNFNNKTENILLIGGGTVGMNLAKIFEDDSMYNVTIIELDEKRANFLSDNLHKTTIIHGNVVDKNILREIAIETFDRIIATTNDDKVNFLSTLLAKQLSSASAISIVNDYNSYSQLIASLGIDVVIDPNEITIKSFIRKFSPENIKAMEYGKNFDIELIEVRVEESSKIVNQTVQELSQFDYFEIVAIYRNDSVIIAYPSSMIQCDDILVVMVDSPKIEMLNDLL